MKKILVVFLGIFLLLIGYFAYDNRIGIQNIWNEKFGSSFFNKPENVINSMDTNLQYADLDKGHIRFAGQNIHYQGMEIDSINYSFLIKGKLLDNKYKSLYDKMPDTLDLDFDQSLYFVENSSLHAYDSKARFAFRHKAEVDTLKIGSNMELHTDQSMLDKLIYEGKVEGYRIYPEKFASPKYVYASNDFEKKYMRHFPANTHFFYSEMDYEQKELLLAFFNSEEGQDFSYPDDRRVYKELIKYADFTGSSKKDLAVVLYDQKRASSGTYKEALIVLAYNDEKQHYYPLYKKIFYEKLTIEVITDNLEKQIMLADAEATQQDLENDVLRLNLSNGQEITLYYDSEFDILKEI